MLKSRHSDNNSTYCLLFKKLTPKQQLNVKGSIVDTNNKLNRVFFLFNPFGFKFPPGDRLINIFPSHFSFHSINRKSEEGRIAHICKLNKLTLQASANSKTAIVVSDVSIKNQITALIAHIYIYNGPIIKTLYHMVNVTSTKAKIFAIRCGINQATQLVNINYIIIIIDLIYAIKHIFNLSVHPYQIQLLAIFRKLREFFKKIKVILLIVQVVTNELSMI